jgi:hypothetical protein
VSRTDWFCATEHDDLGAFESHGFESHSFDLDGSMIGRGHPVYQRTPLRGAQYLGLRHGMDVQMLHRAESTVLDLLLPFYDRAEAEVEAGV